MQELTILTIVVTTQLSGTALWPSWLSHIDSLLAICTSPLVIISQLHLQHPVLVNGDRIQLITAQNKEIQTKDYTTSAIRRCNIFCAACANVKKVNT